MPRERSGTLEFRSERFFAVVRADVRQPDGSVTVERRRIDLQTVNRATAEAKLQALVADLRDGRIVAEPKGTRRARPTVGGYAEQWLRQREAQGVGMLRDERGNLTHHILPEIGTRFLDEVTSGDIRSVLDALMRKTTAKGTPYRRQTIVHVLGVMRRLFKSAWMAEIIEVNPVDRVAMPKIRERSKERCVLLDVEFDHYLASDSIDVELKLLGLCARLIGGMRTSDLHKLQWEHFADDFVLCEVPRSKTGKPQLLEVPEVLRPFLRAWWQGQSSPPRGPVFPARNGRNEGATKKARMTSYADRLRRELFRAGVFRHECSNPSGTRKWGTPCCEQFAHDPLYHPTDRTLPVDFHSFRRAYVTSLAEAQVNVQRAVTLAGHSDAKVHMRYVTRSAEMRRLPAEAMPSLPSLVPAGTERNRLAPKTSIISARPAGIEPATRGLEVEEGSQKHANFSKDLRCQESEGVTADHLRSREITTERSQVGTKRPVQDADTSMHSTPSLDPIEEALASALERASTAGQWAVVATIAAELEARRRARAGVPSLPVERKRPSQR